MQFRVRGTPVDLSVDLAAEVADLEELDGVKLELRQSVAVDESLRGAGNDVVLDGDASDVIEIEDVSGYVDFVKADSVAKRAGERRGDGGAIDLLDVIRSDPQSRGLSRDIRAVRRFKVELPADVGDAVEQIDAFMKGNVTDAIVGVGLDLVTAAAMQKVVDFIDRPVADDASNEKRRKRPKLPGVYQVDDGILLGPDDRLRASTTLPAAEKSLVLIHGTFSHTEAAFGGFRRTEQWRKILEDGYKGNVFALEHPTLGLNPAENALALAKQLPDGAKLDLITHSRGGLVGEMLSLLSQQEPQLSAFDDEEMRTLLTELRRELSDRHVTIDRFARVACPARGTILASRRLDTFAKYLFNVFNLIPGVAASGIAEILKKVVLAFLDTRADPRIIPGLEAQMPESPFIHMLNTTPGRLTDHLGVIAGDVEGSGILKRLFVAAADVFYQQDHDYVVHTASMSEGARRAKAYRSFHKGADYTHSSYFTNEVSRGRVASWLLQEETRTPFEPIAEDRSAVSRAAISRNGGPKLGTVVLVPDMFGTTLVRHGEIVWPDPRVMAADGIGALDEGSSGELLDIYDPLLERLSQRFAVHPFVYDWRRSLREAVVDLTEEVEGLLARGPVYIVGHGVGGVIAARLGANRTLNGRIAAGGGRIVALDPAGPNWSEWDEMLSGSSSLTVLLGIVTRASADEISEVLASWPGPGEARQGAKPPVEMVTVRATRGVGGDADEEAFYVEASHGDIPSSPVLLGALSELLAKGKTTMLSASRPGPVAVTDTEDHRGTLLFPTAEDLVKAALGLEPTVPDAATVTTVELEIVHGDLTHRHAPVIVGHLHGTKFDGAEKALDRAADGVMGHSDALGSYAAAPGSVSMFRIHDAHKPAWAITIGMGEIGDFNANVLRRGVAEACVRLAVVAFHEAGRSAPLRLTVSPVLIGAGTAGMNVEDSIGGIVNGVFDANRRLKTADLDDSVQIGKVEIIEYYEEVAIRAHKAAVQTFSGLRVQQGEALVVAPFVRAAEGGQGGQPAPEYHAGEWQTVTVQAIKLAQPNGHEPRLAANGDDAGEPGDAPEPDSVVDLVFTSVGGRARVEEALSTSQRHQVDLLIEEAVDRAEDTHEVHNTLFELLLPQALKESFQQPGNLVMVLDPEATPYPWELLASRSRDRGTESLAVQAGLLRRLRTTEFRRQVRSGAGMSALVIGDPPTTKFPRLEGARQEALRVADLLVDAGWKVRTVIPDETHDVGANDVVNALYADDYRVVHIAAHGHYDPDDPTKSGVVIGDDRFLTTLEFASMSSVPEFVFLNCCHLGRVDAGGNGTRAAAHGNFHRLAASVSQQLIENGVRAIAAAGWAVDDAAALAFAEELYGNMLSGLGFGDAVKYSRLSVRSEHSDNNTWGAYQCYGPPAFTLVTIDGRDADQDLPVSPGDLSARLRQLARDADLSAEGEASEQLAKTLTRLVTDVPLDFVGGRERYSAGLVYLHLGRAEEAVIELEAARAGLGVGAPLRLSEHLAVAHQQAATEQLRGGSLVKARTHLDKAYAYLSTLQGAIGDALDPTASRLEAEWILCDAMLRQREGPGGSGNGDAPKQAVAKAEKLYRGILKASDDADYRTGFEIHFCRIMRGMKPLKADRSVAELAAAAAERRSHDPWTSWAPAYRALADSLAAKAYPDTHEAVLGAFQEAFGVCPSRRERIAVRNHLELLAAFAHASHTEALRALVSALFEPGGGDDSGTSAPATPPGRRRVGVR